MHKYFLLSSLLLCCNFNHKKILDSASDKKVCTELSKPYIHYVASENNLFVCIESDVLDVFKVSHGSNGLGKKKKGDRKTPLGFYTIKSPRKSSSVWRTFIHINYPTSDQSKKGYTGSFVGLHGPNEYFPYFNDLVNYSAGCLVTSNNRDIDLISNYVVNFEIKDIFIEK